MLTVGTSSGEDVCSRNSRDDTVPLSEPKYSSRQHPESQETVLPTVATSLVHLN